MPESKGRSKPSYTPPRSAQKAQGPNPRWFVPVMLGLMVIGLLWVVTYYISGAHQYPVPQIERWNLGVGFALMMAGFLMTTRWR
ncbi:cell division protein CrgA [Oryzobacter sp. R7]|uniref:cell division protein CrgA n=1 Tax=Oryzobacter faecalis TaxID=3388656 RepID=UPI00398D08E9